MKSKHHIFLFIILGIIACRKGPDFIKSPEIFGLASPITFSISDTTEIVSSDYFNNPLAIDSISKIKGFKIDLSKDKSKIYLIPISQNLPFIANLNIWVGEVPYGILLKKSSKKAVNFQLKSNAKKVAIVGDFVGWDPSKVLLKNNNGIFDITLDIDPGQYGYQFVEDGIWKLDPNTKQTLSNGQGGFNSLLIVKKDSNEHLKPFITSEKINENWLSIAKKNQVTTLIAYWQNHYLDSNFYKLTKDSIKIKIPKESENIERSHLRVYASNAYGMSNDILIPLKKGEPITDPTLLTRQDFESNILYFMMIDRFKNGTTSNDYKMDSTIVKSKAQYYGGDILGLSQVIDNGYFNTLGVNALWLSPITQNPLGAWGQFTDPNTKFSGYHGYWPISLTTVDHRLGDSKTLQQMLDKAHGKKMNVFLDYVAHHLHIEHPLIEKNPNWVTPLYLPDGTMNTEKWDEYRLTTWFDTFMPTLNLQDQKITDYMVDSAMHWIKNVPFDGFRHDATKHIPLNFWRTLTKKIKTEIEIPNQKSIYQIGETYGNNELISSYVNTGMLNAQFDFNLYDALLPVFTQEGESFDRLSQALQQSFKYYGYHHVMGNITGNQDKPRFISYADGSILPSTAWQETKRIGWKQNISVKNPLAYQKLAMAQAFNMTIPGIPIIYYGDEFGMPGANDPDNRRMMKFNGLNANEKLLLEITKKLIHFRKNNMALLYGDLEIVLSDKDQFIYKRSYFGQSVYVIFNKSAHKHNYTLAQNKTHKAIFGTLINNQITTEPYSFSIIVSQ